MEKRAEKVAHKLKKIVAGEKISSFEKESGQLDENKLLTEVLFDLSLDNETRYAEIRDLIEDPSMVEVFHRVKRKYGSDLKANLQNIVEGTE